MQRKRVCESERELFATHQPTPVPLPRILSSFIPTGSDESECMTTVVVYHPVTGGRQDHSISSKGGHTSPGYVTRRLPT